MRKQRAGSFVIRTVVLLLVLVIGVVIFLALLPQLFSADISFGPHTLRCSAPYVAIKNTGLLAFTLGEWEGWTDESSVTLKRNHSVTDGNPRPRQT